ncbi:sterol desaturase family protein [Desulfosoma caldarium]|uniref:Sterol desaturase/sphingolipid hydroxylase (Fatty acid hydroxylase superfamily) n=1 Tax=Desulfosoma caldarium TaxID=610254 RepID=A0A3N1UME3_9BACT|nr:sterol desaturase family protein [Desulfosoma caldarium]ROQ90908.1 sterol desaturase/sphingolipid hydroxylase (fatty acid hydroxylase superfamily) [Desulfosoma caldarium]
MEPDVLEWRVRMACFLAVFAAVAILEAVFPRRRRTQPKTGRWVSNLAMIGLGNLLTRAASPLVPAGIAAVAARHGWGLLPALDLSPGAGVLLSVIALDGVIYLQHVLTHALPSLWRLHMVHHADLDLDCTTGVRFHPVEIFLSAGLKSAAVAALGAPVTAVVLFEVVLNGCSVFNHANLKLPRMVDRILRLVLVTPDMHRVHHSVIIRETHSNFGFCLSWWDRLFGTYKAQPEKGHDGMTLGLSQFRDPTRLGLGNLLVLPITGDPGRQPINRH